MTNAGQNLELATTVGSGDGGASMFMQQAITLGTGSLTISGIGASSTAVVVIGGFYGSNSYAGGTIISSGKLILASGYPRNMDTTSRLTFTGSGGSLDLGGNNATLPFLTGSSGTIIGNDTGSGSPTLTINQSLNTSFAGGFADGANGVLSLVKQGTGSLTVGGMSSHSGPTTIDAGRLLGGSGGGMTNSVIEIASGATNGYVATIPNGQWVGKELVYGAGTTHIQYDFGGQTVDTAYQTPMLVRVLNDLKKLKKQAKDAYRAANSELGYVKEKLSDALEDAVESSLKKQGKTDVFKRFVVARQQYAKLFAVEKATDLTKGNVSGAKLAGYSATGRKAHFWQQGKRP